jgi:hypothetical protein
VDKARAEQALRDAGAHLRLPGDERNADVWWLSQPRPKDAGPLSHTVDKVMLFDERAVVIRHYLLKDVPSALTPAPTLTDEERDALWSSLGWWSNVASLTDTPSLKETYTKRVQAISNLLTRTKVV